MTDVHRESATNLELSNQQEITLITVVTGAAPRGPAVRAAFAISLAIAVAACSNSSPTTSTAALPTTSANAAESTAPSIFDSTTTTEPTTTTAPPQPTTTRESVVVPQHVPPAIDGVIGDGEWAGSTTETMSDGALVRFMSSDDVLYVAVAGDKVGAVNVLIATGTEVLILHSSAALGSARYIPADDAWQLDYGFDWCCRRSSDESARAELFADEGWQANIGLTGAPGSVEYAIAVPWAEASLVISSIRDENDRGFWPMGLSEDIRDELLGTPPPERSFHVDEWPRLIGSR